MGRYTIGGQRGYFYFVSKDGKNLNAEQVLALLNGEIVSTTFHDNFTAEQHKLGLPLTARMTEGNPHFKMSDLQKQLSWAKLCRSAADENHNYTAYAEADEVVRDLERQLGSDTPVDVFYGPIVDVELRPSVVFAGKGDEPLSAERKAQLKGTIFEHCETENEVTARHFDAMS